jgi:hypothetical protein
MSLDLNFFNSWNETEQVEILNKQLPNVITYEGEFGTEIVSFIPFIYNLHLKGLIGDRKVSTYSGMKPYYYFLTHRNFIERKEKRFWVPSEERWWPGSNEHQRIPILGEEYPNFEQSRTKKDVLFIQNKYCVEWDEGPINYLSLDVLHKIFEKTKGKCKVVYSRQGILSTDTQLGISVDHNTELSFEDLALCEKFSHVKVLEKSSAFDFRSYNSKKLFWINRAFLLAGVQGGSNYPWTFFNKAALILHKRGRETEFSYNQGFYTYLTKPPLQLKVVDNDELLLLSIFDILENRIPS